MASIGAAVEGELRGAATRTPHLALGATRVGLSASQTDAVPISRRADQGAAEPRSLEMPKPAGRAGYEHPAEGRETRWI